MGYMAEKVNKVSEVIAKITPDPAERFSIASVLVEMYRYEINKQFTTMPSAESTKTDDSVKAS